MALKLLISFILSLSSFAFAAIKGLSWTCKPTECTLFLSCNKLFVNICLPHKTKNVLNVIGKLAYNYTTTLINKNSQFLDLNQFESGLNCKMQISKPVCIFNCSSICLSCCRFLSDDFFDALNLKWKTGKNLSG